MKKIIALMILIGFSGAYAAAGTTVTAPKHMRYVDGIAECTGICRIIYSVDGKVSDMPVKLFVIENGKKRVAKASEHMIIRWGVQTLGAKQGDCVQYEAAL
jgi:hypothetical protein